MSVSSLAEDSALRLTAAAPVQPAAAAHTAAAAAAAAVAAGSTPEAAAAAGTAAAETAAPTKPSVGASALTQLVKYIPTETLTLYVAVEAALGDLAPRNGQLCQADFRARWWWVCGLAAATALLALGLGFRSQKQLDPSGRFKPPLVEIIAATAAFIVWALSLNSTPLRDFCGYSVTAWNPVVLLSGTIVIATAAYVFGKTVTWQKVLVEGT